MDDAKCDRALDVIIGAAYKLAPDLWFQRDLARHDIRELIRRFVAAQLAGFADSSPEEVEAAAFAGAFTQVADRCTEKLRRLPRCHICSTILTDKNRRHRARTCYECDRSGKRKCECSTVFVPDDGQKVCPTCEKKLKREVDGQQLSKDKWNSALYLLGGGMKRGRFAGAKELLSISEVHTQKVAEKGTLAALRYNETLSNAQEAQFIDKFVAVFQAGFNGEQTFGHYLDDDEFGLRCLGYFLTAPCGELARKTGLSPEEIQRMRSQLFDIERTEVENARKALGYTEAETRLHRLKQILNRLRDRVDGTARRAEEKASLTDEERTVLLWSQQGLSIREIEDKTGVHRSTVSRRLKSARQKVSHPTVTDNGRRK